MRTAGRVVIAGPSVWLPEDTETAAEAIARGRLDEDTADDLGYQELRVSNRLAPPEMAALAAENALRSAGVDGDEIGLLLHASCYYQGHDFFSPAHFVADRVGTRRAIPVGIAQMSNGGAVAMQLAVTHLLSDPSVGAALVTTADRLCEPGFDRWRGDYGVGYGDGATAMVLLPGDREEHGALELLSVRSVAASEYGSMMYAGDPFSPAPRWLAGSVDTRRNKKAYLSANGSETFVKCQQEKLREVIITGLAEAGIEPDDPALRRVLLPRLARNVIEDAYLPTIAEITAAEQVDLGAHTGHLGAGDLLASMAALVRQPLLESGEVAVVVSAGAGFTWSCAVVRSL